MAYDRYKFYRTDDNIKTVPFIPIRKKSTDLYYQFKRNMSRLDIVSYEYYNDPSFGWLIMQANPEYGSCEFSISDNSVLRIPYPLSETLLLLDEDINNHIKYYGLS